MAGKNDKWSMFKNYMHNELGITKEDIREWIQEAVEMEARKMVDESFSKYSINDRISREIDKHIGQFSDYSLRQQISNELVKRLKIVIE